MTRSCAAVLAVEDPDTNPRLTVDHHHGPIVFRVDGPAEHAGPEAALCREIGGVEYNDLVGDLHAIIVATTSNTSTLSGLASWFGAGGSSLRALCSV
jgi:hypothetical protein